jgi:hypothetical protein
MPQMEALGARNGMDVAGILRDEEISFIVAGRGSTVSGAKAMAAKRGLSKVQFVGLIPMTDSPDAVSAFDIGLCPYRKTPFADACSPMRLLLYTAAGLPTVCTDLEEVRRMNFPNVVLVRDDPETLAEGIRRVRGRPRARPAGIAEYDLPRLVGRYEQVLRG